MQAVVDEFPTMPGPRQALVNALRSVGLVQQELEGEAEQALASLRRASESADRLAKDFPLRPEYRRDAAKCHNNLGRFLCLQRRPRRRRAPLPRRDRASTSG